jgi:hypothetical protein
VRTVTGFGYQWDPEGYQTPAEDSDQAVEVKRLS